MGRSLKRVPLDFDWPTDKVWDGYLNPHRSEECAACEGSGYSLDGKRINDQWYGNVPFDPAAYGAVQLEVDHPALQAYARWQVEQNSEFYGRGDFAVQRNARRLHALMRGQWCHHLIQVDVDALVAADRLWNFTRVPLNDEQRANCHPNGWTKEPNGYQPTADEVNAWSIGGMGHDSINSWVCVKARCEREGVVMTCAACGGDGQYWPDPEIKHLHDAWLPTEPPTGDGWQLWETVSEGSPISPVFATEEGFTAYLVSEGYTEKAARNFCKSGWVPSGVLDTDSSGKKVMYENIEAAEIMKGQEE